MFLIQPTEAALLDDLLQAASHPAVDLRRWRPVARADSVKRDADQRAVPGHEPAHETFKVLGSIFYVGANELTSFLIATPAGHILIDSGSEEMAPMVASSVRKLGFKVEDIKILLNTQGHGDHAGGFAALKKMTGARLMVMEGDAELVSNGGKDDFAFGDKYTHPPAKVDRVLHDGDRVELGGAVLTGHLIPGHTKGGAAWTMKVSVDGKTYAVAFVGSTTINPGVHLVGNAKYPGIAEDYARAFGVLSSLPCDLFLASHGSFFSLQDKAAILEKGAGPNPFIDPDGCRAFIAQTKETYLRKLQEEKQR